MAHKPSFKYQSGPEPKNTKSIKKIKMLLDQINILELFIIKNIPNGEVKIQQLYQPNSIQTTPNKDEPFDKN